MKCSKPPCITRWDIYPSRRVVPTDFVEGPNIEVEAKPSFWNFWGSQKYDIIPHGENTGLLHTHNEAPNFTWRRQFPAYK
jgi:hypothetical protein